LEAAAATLFEKSGRAAFAGNALGNALVHALRAAGCDLAGIADAAFRREILAGEASINFGSDNACCSASRPRSQESESDTARSQLRSAPNGTDAFAAWIALEAAAATLFEKSGRAAFVYTDLVGTLRAAGGDLAGVADAAFRVDIFAGDSPSKRLTSRLHTVKTSSNPFWLDSVLGLGWRTPTGEACAEVLGFRNRERAAVVSAEASPDTDPIDNFVHSEQALSQYCAMDGGASPKSDQPSLQASQSQQRIFSAQPFKYRCEKRKVWRGWLAPPHPAPSSARKAG
jgi:hypothetical protein